MDEVQTWSWSSLGRLGKSVNGDMTREMLLSRADSGLWREVLKLDWRDV